MRYNPLPASFYQKKRSAFTALMHDNATAVLCSNDVKHTNADDVMGFAQNNDLFYLSGIDQDETMLFLYPQARKDENREILFLKKSDPTSKLWDGETLSKEQAMELSGVNRVEWMDDFEKILDSLTFEADEIYLCHNEHQKRATRNQETQEDRWIKWFKEKYPLHNYNRVATILRELRPIKSAHEIAQIQQAIDIGIKGFERVLRNTEVGMKEYQIEAEITYNTIQNGGNRHAFLPIVASGKNACALHYNTNDNICHDEDFLLLDFGVCYGNYNSDTTRCFPINGTFTSRQKEVYSAVLHCLKEGSKLMKPGVFHANYEVKMALLIEEQLIKLGLLNADDVVNQDPKKPLYKKYFMHGTAHYLGLDVHDVGSYERPFEPGMVLTCEPGIYIPEENIGCRLENDYLITDNGNINLSEKMPIEIEDIERFMAQ
ncbi:MAG: aminopeptidase P N-terminal domain-containing protein [Crocinitomicaceae bacterium]|nr:aminopeptidase P N-terminal domain-containing protein [Crocinitomicaceae bacterium]